MKYFWQQGIQLLILFFHRYTYTYLVDSGFCQFKQTCKNKENNVYEIGGFQLGYKSHDLL